MADAKISQLPVAGAVADDNLVPIVDTDSNVTKQATVADVIKDVLDPSQVVLAGDGVDVTYAAGAAGSYDTVTLSTNNQSVASFLTPTRVVISPVNLASNTPAMLSDLTGLIPANTAYVAELNLYIELQSLQDINPKSISGNLPNTNLDYVGNWEQVVCETDRQNLTIKQNADSQIDSAGTVIDLGINPNSTFGGATSRVAVKQNFLVDNNTGTDQGLEVEVSSDYSKTTDNIIVLAGSYLKLVKVK
jgi:hypothetical protein